uniref:DBB domain-containing protein n=1 Tax=Neogobius melanostomus TaxID=47308 RepID=A0A8C6TB46_9GOBI
MSRSRKLALIWDPPDNSSVVLSSLSVALSDNCTGAMNHTAQELLIIFDTSAEQWATYLQSVVSEAIPPEAVCRYDIRTASSKRDDLLRLSQYMCKVLVLSKGMLKGLCQMKRFFLARVLSPASRVVVLLCGVNSLKPFLDLVPLNGDQCLQISSEQDREEHLTAVMDVVRKGVLSPASNANPVSKKTPREKQKMHKKAPMTGHNVLSTVLLVPSRVPCGSPVEVFLLLKNQSAAKVTAAVFSKDDQIVKVKPNRWSDSVLRVNAPDFPAGIVKVTVLSNGVAPNETELLYYSSLEEMSRLLSKATDPVQFMCQALHVPSVEKLDETLSSMLLKGMPSGRFQGLQGEGTPERESCDLEVPTLLHFAALHGLKGLSSVLLQCPGAAKAVQAANRHGDTPTEIAEKHGHTELHVLLKETLKTISTRKDHGDSSMNETMHATGSASNSQKEQPVSDRGEEEGEEELYTAFGLGDAYDTLGNPNPTVVIANRPPAPTPRPEMSDTRINYNAKVLQKNMGKTELYCRPAKQTQGREDTLSPTYDTFVALPTPELHQRARTGSLPFFEGAKGHINHGQRVQKEATQQDKLSQLRAAVLNNKGDDSVYDSISIVHHTPSAVANESPRKSQSEKADFYNKPLKKTSR